MASSYHIAKGLLAAGTLMWPQGTIRALLVGPTYTFNPHHQYVADVIAHEVSGGTYARVTVTGRSGALNISLGRGVLDANDTVFEALSGVSTTGAILFKQVTSSPDPDRDPLVFYFGYPLFVADGSNLKIEYSSQGVGYITE